MKKSNGQTKSKIISAAWKLFYEQGFEHTTVYDIIYESGTSKGSFYHYFKGKEDLLASLADLFDEKYNQLKDRPEISAGAVEALEFLNRELFEMIETSVDIDLLKRLYSAQLTTGGTKELLDHNRMYFKLLRRIVAKGQNDGELTTGKNAAEIVKLYALFERGMIYDWCLCNGEYSLTEYSAFAMRLLLDGLKQLR